MNVLVADDLEFIRNIIKHTLELKYRFLVDTAQDGKEASNLLAKKIYDIVISDYDMPYKNGIDLSKEVKKTSPKTFFILISSTYNIDNSHWQSDAFLSKPFTPCDLYNIIDEYLKSRPRPDRYNTNIEACVEAVGLPIGKVHILNISKSGALIASPKRLYNKFQLRINGIRIWSTTIREKTSNNKYIYGIKFDTMLNELDIKNILSQH